MVSTPPAIIQRIDAVMTAVNGDNGDALQASFAPDATVVDENSPFLWSGPQAAARWWHAVDRYARKQGVHGLVARVRSYTECKLDREGDDAYVIAQLRIGFRSNPKMSESGGWVLTLHRTGGDWKITSATWATTP